MELKIKPNNRYMHIHVLFRVLAETKLDMRLMEYSQGSPERTKIYQMAKVSKSYWKSFFKVKSLKDLSTNELQDLERILRQRIDFLSSLSKVKK